MLYLTDRLTLVVTCYGCGAEHDTGEHSSNWAYWHAESLGWLVSSHNAPYQSYNVYCPDCLQRAEDGWVPSIGDWCAYCTTCEDEEDFPTEDEAKKWKRHHRCFEWEPPDPQVRIEGPIERAQRQAEYEKAVKQSNVKDKERKRQNEEMNRLVAIGMTADTARKSWWRRLLLRLAGV